jgi:DNA repair protein RecO
MSRERTLETFVLKRTDFGEADQIVTLFSRQEGKLRVLVKAAKLPTSKLSPALQPLFCAAVTLAGSAQGSTLPKAIRARVLSAYPGILHDQNKLGAWYVASELLLKSLGDQAPNEPLFNELMAFAQFLHATPLSALEAQLAQVQFQARALAALGLGVQLPPSGSRQIWFSMDRGGFLVDDASSDSRPVSWETCQIFEQLLSAPYGVKKTLSQAHVREISSLINGFVNYQLEREIKSQLYLSPT